MRGIRVSHECGRAARALRSLGLSAPRDVAVHASSSHASRADGRMQPPSLAVEATVPLDGVKETVLVKVELLVLTSKPDGGVTTRFAERFVPETEKF